MAADDDPHGVGPASPGDPDGSWIDVAVPDDISELEPEIAAYRREQRAIDRRRSLARRRATAHPLWRWMLPRDRPVAPGFTARPRGLMLPLMMTAGALALSAIVTVLLTLLAPRPQHAVEPEATLATPSVASGQTGGLVPDLAIYKSSSGTAVPIRDIRPAVLLLHPAGCNCTKTLATLAQEAVGTKFHVAAVTPEQRGSDVPDDVGQVGDGLVSYDDPGGRLVSHLAGAVDADRLAAVVVRSDGTISEILSGSNLTSGDLLSDLQFQLARN